MADNGVTITVAEVRSALALLLGVVEERFGPEIDLVADHYWSLDAVASFDLDGEPEVGAGQLTEDVNSVISMLARDLDEEAIIVWHDLDHLVGVLRRTWPWTPPREPNLCAVRGLASRGSAVSAAMPF